MAKFDPLEETQENLHPVILAHRAREEAAAAPIESAGRVRFATAAVLIGTGVFLLWLLLPAQS